MCVRARIESGLRYVAPAEVAVADADSSNVGIFAGIRQASDPDRKFENFRLVPVVFAGASGKASLEPLAGGVLMRVVLTKQMKIPPGGIHRLY